ncbi:phosphatase PAP2 family protein [Algibacter lectus]|uniref:Phosphoesterase PA-phosphatase related n=2 Tax=Algibacter lectus TaxID=221126 RepID=A0A090V8Z0_9FLAO|nr:phosphatase PAP2 family protein [Algibacter lectus]MWW24970.1 phosphatase PAP2 family protein [Algibacter lectus]GAL61310.1 phosphoesterase PA-phosphatase related [Algibacter lectus]
MNKVLIVFLLFCSNFMNGQTTPESFGEQTIWQTFKYDMGSVGRSVGYAFTRPTKWKDKQWIDFAGIVAGTALLTLADDEIDHWSDGFRSAIPNNVLHFGGKTANPEGNYSLSGAVYFTGLFIKNEKLRRTGVLMLASSITGGVLQQVTVRVLGRSRPLTGDSANSFDPLLLKKVNNYDSFFSGHTVLSFGNAYAIAKQFKSPWIKAGIYTVGMIPGFTRIVISKHWFSDVALGTVMSILIVESIDKYLDSRYNQKYNNKKVNWDLSFAPGQIGLNVRF